MTPCEAPEIAVGVVQCALPGPREANLGRIRSLVRAAAAAGAKIVLTPELLDGPYFPSHEREEAFAEARALHDSETLVALRELAAELHVVLPYSFFERAGQAYYNSLAVIDADGSLLGTYRKSHLPDGPGYEEKYYFRPGDTGFRVWATRWGRLGFGICWDQWFPECARAMALQGAEILLYPTAIGSEPADPESDTRDPWRRVMIGHAVANAMPVCAANRIGEEESQRFYGSSFIANARGEVVAELGHDEEGVRVALFDRAALSRYRATWGFFRDRRPDLYGVLLSADGAPEPARRAKAPRRTR